MPKRVIVKVEANPIVLFDMLASLNETQKALVMNELAGVLMTGEIGFSGRVLLETFGISIEAVETVDG